MGVGDDCWRVLGNVIAADCQRMYRLAPNHLRRQFNQAFFDKIMVDEGEVTDAQLAEPLRSSWPTTGRAVQAAPSSLEEGQPRS
jgi:hypothetical protein